MRCSQCDKPFDPGTIPGGSKIACPYCSAVQTVPGGSGAAAAPTGKPIADRAGALGLPPDSGPEVDVRVVRPSMFRARPCTFFGVFVGMIAAAVGCGVFYFKSSTVPAVLCAIPAVFLFGVLAYWWFEQARERLQITNKRVMWVRGIFSKHSMEVLHDRIQNMEIDQSFWNRLWGVGTLSISSAGEADFEIIAKNIPNPYRVREIIDAYRPM